MISGVEPTPELLNRISAMAHNFNIPKNDALFPFMVMMDQYHGVFSELPNKINDAVSNSVSGAERAADLVVNDASKKVQTIVAGSLEPLATAAFEKGVNKYIRQLDSEATNSAKANAIPVAIAGVALAVLVGIGLGWAGGTWARSNSDAQLIAAATASQATVAGQLAQKDSETAVVIANLKAEQAASIANLNAARGWAGTAEGQLAFKFFTTGGGLMAAKCQAEHWTLGKTGKGEKLCMPQYETLMGWKEGNVGWVIP